MEIAWRIALPTTTDSIISIVGMFMVLEAARRTTGWIFPSVCLLFIFYARFGGIFPGELAHTSYPLVWITRYTWLGLEGIFGMAMGILVAFAFLFILARLQNIPKELYHAAKVDGASPFQRFFHITLPQLTSVLSVLFLFRFIWTINKFDDIFLLTRGQAGTKVMTLKIYEYAFGEFNIGAGAAAAMLLFGVLSVFLFIYFRWVHTES